MGLSGDGDKYGRQDYLMHPVVGVVILIVIAILFAFILGAIAVIMFT